MVLFNLWDYSQEFQNTSDIYWTGIKLNERICKGQQTVQKAWYYLP